MFVSLHIVPYKYVASPIYLFCSTFLFKGSLQIFPFSHCVSPKTDGGIYSVLFKSRHSTIRVHHNRAKCIASRGAICIVCPTCTSKDHRLEAPNSDAYVTLSRNPICTDMAVSREFSAAGAATPSSNAIARLSVAHKNALCFVGRCVMAGFGVRLRFQSVT